MNPDPIHIRIIAMIIMVCGMVGSLAIAHAIWEGYWFFITGSTLGMYWCWYKRTFPLMALDAFYTAANLIGIYNQILT
jgi:hypothetical protein